MVTSLISACSGGTTGSGTGSPLGGTFANGSASDVHVAGGTRATDLSNLTATGSVTAIGGSSNAGATQGSGGSTLGSTVSTEGKRGIAANVAPGSAFYPAVSWWYNWSNRNVGVNVGIEFVPMIWNQTTVSAALPAGSKYVLGFNEPNFFAQANLSASQAASYWPDLEATAAAANVAVVSPALNYCGPAAQCHGTDPYQYLKDFLAACNHCRVDYIAIHWYNCDLPSLRDYLEPGGNLPGFEQFGKPIWLTEFSCDGSASVAQQEAYMREAIPYLENNPHVFRYSWFSAGPIPNAKLINDDGTPTALGKVYVSLPR